MEYIGLPLLFLSLAICWDIMFNDVDAIANIVNTIRGKKREE